MLANQAGLQNNLLSHFRCGMFIKDIQGTYTWVNDELLRRQKLERHEIIGKTDKVLPWAGYVRELRLHDQAVLDQKTAVTFHEVIHRQGYDVDGICHKSPAFGSSGQLVGVCGIFIDSPQPKLAAHIKLSLREKQCLINLSRGMSAHECANNLNLSPRTIEDYLEKLRSKFRCKNQAALLTWYYENIVMKNHP